MSKSDIISNEGFICLYPNAVTVLKMTAILPIYTNSDSEFRSSLQIVPSWLKEFRCIFALRTAYHSTFKNRSGNIIELCLDGRLWSHFQTSSIRICTFRYATSGTSQTGVIVPPVLSQALKASIARFQKLQNNRETLKNSEYIDEKTSKNVQ